ncbi:30865_t:CDS:2, partial [Gigaspora margarita]
KTKKYTILNSTKQRQYHDESTSLTASAILKLKKEKANNKNEEKYLSYKNAYTTRQIHHMNTAKAPCKRRQGTIQMSSRHYANIVKIPHKRHQRMSS